MLLQLLERRGLNHFQSERAMLDGRFVFRSMSREEERATWCRRLDPAFRRGKMLYAGHFYYTDVRSLVNPPNNKR